MNKTIMRLRAIAMILLMVLFAFTLSACDQNDPKETDSGPNGETPAQDLVIMNIDGFEVKESIYKIMMYEEAIALQKDSEPEGLDDDAYETWLVEFFKTEIDGRMPFDIVREGTLHTARVYAYLMKSAKAAGIQTEDADRYDIEADTLMSIGDDYDSANPDEYFQYKYGVTKKQFMDYVVSLSEIQRFKEQDALKQNVSAEKIEEYKSLYGDYFSTKDIRNIFLQAGNAAELVQKRPLAQSILEKIQSGEDMIALVREYSQAEDSNEGLFTVSKDQKEYPDSILDWVHGSHKGDSGVVEAADGLYILRCEDARFDETAEQEIRKQIGLEQLESIYEEEAQKEQYTPRINDNIYNAYTKLPGDLMPDENAVG